MKTQAAAEGEMDMCSFSSLELDIEQPHLQWWGEDGRMGDVKQM